MPRLSPNSGVAVTQSPRARGWMHLTPSPGARLGRGGGGRWVWGGSGAGDGGGRGCGGSRTSNRSPWRAVRWAGECRRDWGPVGQPPEASQAGAWSSGGSAPPDRGPRTVDRGTERGRASTPARLSAVRPRRRHQAQTPPQLCPRGQGCRSPWSKKGPSNKEASPTGPRPFPVLEESTRHSLNVEFPFSGPIPGVRTAGLQEAMKCSRFQTALFLAGSPLPLSKFGFQPLASGLRWQSWHLSRKVPILD